ncbi:MAG TPA: carboxypeptidase-like regulatory domain-containing protein [Gemmatimonadaceae bacterium]|nr:carboxypeptidase-like regulatory domain-containing protein [Gemmatimonadaceae bacterium]
MRSLVSIIAIAAIASITSIAAAQQTDVIRGRVTGPDTALQGVNIKATSYQGSVVKTTTTDKGGRFTLIFVNGEGDYWLDFTKLGFAPKRFEIKKIGDEEVLLADARLTSVVQTLGAVQTIAQGNRAVPSRNAAGVDVGGGDKPLTNNGLPPDQAGNLAAMAATVAGIQVIPGLDGAADMYSLLGLTGDQNNTTFNGLGSGVSTLPPDILATTSISPYPFDVSKGGFSGAQISIQTIPGSNFSRRSVTNADIAPALEWADATADAQGQKFTNMRLGGNAAGAMSTDKAFYNTAYNVGRRFSDVQSLINTSPFGLAAAGVSGDSVARLRSILGNQHIPATTSGVPSLQAQDVAQGSANIDVSPSSSGAGHAFTLGVLGNYQRTQPVSRGGLLLSTPAHGGDASFWGVITALVHSNYFWSAVLSKTTLGFAASGNSSEPYEQLPEGSVRVSSTLPDGSASVKSLFFGGNSLLSSSSNRTVQLSNQLSWFSLDNKHTLKLTSSVSHDAFTSDLSPSLLGSFAFNSLADLDAGRASSYTRMLSQNTQSGAQLMGAASLGDYWRPSSGVQLQYGVRVDANRFLSTPALNHAVLDALGVGNSSVPNRAYVSPRIGMQWYYGSAPQVSYAPGAARPPRAVIHAGVGIFQNMASAQLIAPAVSSTGLPNSTQTITCVGGAVPFPDWNSFLTDPASIPSRCADGSTGTVFSTSAPAVTLFDPQYRQPRSLRAAADWSGPVADNRFVLGVQGIVSSGLQQSGAVDVNFNSTARFNLANEDNRPVFADPSAIVPGTGAIATAGSRVSPVFQHVWDQRSDLKVSSKQVSVNLKPVTANAMLKWDATYTLLNARESFYGFTSTVGDPFAISSGPHLQGGRHAVTLRWSDFPLFDIVYVTAGVQLSSGQKYTPMIGNDVNGDGSLNDRAFVFDPARTSDSATSSAMRSLLAAGTPAARDCLQRQLNTLSSRGSCQAPWTANAGLLVKFNPQKIGLPKRATISLQVQNPLGLADLALHGSNDVRGWGQNIAPDQNLVYVRGFDPATHQFKYDVNQRFGSTRPQQSAAHALPFISLSVNVDIGVTRERQLLTRQLDIGRGRPGAKQSAESIKLLGTASIPNPMGMILQQSDSLHLTKDQADSLATLSHAFAVFADSIWTPVSRYLENLPDGYSHGAAYDSYVSARQRTVDYLLTLVPDAKRLLTASQRRRLPMQIANYLDERVLKFLRSSSAGDNGGVIIR